MSGFKSSNPNCPGNIWLYNCPMTSDFLRPIIFKAAGLSSIIRCWTSRIITPSDILWRIVSWAMGIIISSNWRWDKPQKNAIPVIAKANGVGSTIAKGLMPKINTKLASQGTKAANNKIPACLRKIPCDFLNASKRHIVPRRINA